MRDGRLGASLTGETKRPQGVLLLLAHATLVVVVFVVVAQHVQDAVRHQVADLAIDRVAELVGLRRGASDTR